MELTKNQKTLLAEWETDFADSVTHYSHFKEMPHSELGRRLYDEARNKLFGFRVACQVILGDEYARINSGEDDASTSFVPVPIT